MIILFFIFFTSAIFLSKIQHVSSRIIREYLITTTLKVVWGHRIRLLALKFLRMLARSGLRWTKMKEKDMQEQNSKRQSWAYVIRPPSHWSCDVLRPSARPPLKLYFEAILYYKVCSSVRWIVCAKSKCGGRSNMFYKYLIFRIVGYRIE